MISILVDFKLVCRCVKHNEGGGWEYLIHSLKQGVRFKNASILLYLAAFQISSCFLSISNFSINSHTQKKYPLPFKRYPKTLDNPKVVVL